jgi:hypothetical protein
LLEKLLPHLTDLDAAVRHKAGEPAFYAGHLGLGESMLCKTFRDPL